MDTERQAGTGESVPPLTRADVERLRSKVENSAQLDLSLQNLQHIDLSYLDLQGANLRGADLQEAQLRGTNLSEADLREADLSDTDLDGADLSRAHLGKHEANRVKLHRTKLSYAMLRGLDLRGFDLTDLESQIRRPMGRPRTEFSTLDEMLYRLRLLLVQHHIAMKGEHHETLPLFSAPMIMESSQANEMHKCYDHKSQYISPHSPLL